MLFRLLGKHIENITNKQLSSKITINSIKTFNKDRISVQALVTLLVPKYIGVERRREFCHQNEYC